MVTTKNETLALPFSHEVNLDWSPPEPPSLQGEKDIFFDLETTGLKWWDGDRPVGAAIRTRDGRSWYLPWAQKGGGNLCEETCKRWMKTELRDKKLFGANIKFDNHMSYVWGVDFEEQNCELGDVQYYAALLDDNRKQFNLDLLGKEFLGLEKIKGLNPKSISDYHAGEVDAYARRDVELVHGLVDKFWPMMEAEDLLRVQKLEDELILVTCEMERNASPIDTDLLAKWTDEIEQEFYRAVWRIFQETGIGINPKSPTDLEKLFKDLGIETGEFTDAGAQSFGASALKKLDHPVAQEVLRARRLKELLDKYFYAYTKVIGEDGILRYELHQLRGDEYGTISGRYSSAKKNIQAVMAVENQIERYGEGYIVRELFIPESGYHWLAADAKQIEYRLFAHYASPPGILEAYAKNPEISFHEEVWEMVKRINPDLGYKPLKNLNFAKLYGAGLAKVAEMINLPRRVSDGFVHAYDRMFPEASKLLLYASHVAEVRGYVKTILGRRARFKGGRKLHSAVNRIIQGSAADIMKKKLIELYRKRKELCLKMRMTVHDEVCGDIPDQEHADKVKEVLDSQSFDLKVPILWDCKIGKNWAECK